MLRSWYHSLVAALLLTAACAHDLGQEPCRVAVMPVDVLGVSADDGRVLQVSMAIELDASTEHGTVAGEDVNRALTDRDEDLGTCLDSDACLAAVGELAAADEVLALRLAGLGDTHVVRARLVDVAQGIAVQDMEETVLGDRLALAGYAPQLMRRLFPAEAEPWYRSWWVWTAAAAAVGATAATVALVMSGQDDDVLDLGDL